jgi:hypothetical protein
MAERRSRLRPPPGDLVGAELLDGLRNPDSDVWAWARDAVDGYFHTDEYTGRWFERLGRDQTWSANTFTPIDLVAVSMLGVAIPPTAALELLSGERLSRIGELLALIEDVPLHEVPAENIDVGWPPARLWAELKAIPGLGRTKRSKLMARKRPALIPVYDQRTKHRLGLGEEIWLPIRAMWNEELVASIARMRGEIDALDDISLLRVLDVAVWRYDEALRPRLR